MSIVVTRWTPAPVTINQVNALTSISARLRQTLINVHFTVKPCEASSTLTGVLINFVDTDCAIAARIAKTFIDIVLAVDSSSSSWTYAFVAVNKIFANTLVLTRLFSALVYLGLAEQTSVTWQTFTGVGVVTVFAVAMSAGGGEAVVDVRLAIASRKARIASTRVSVNTVGTKAAVVAGFISTVINVYFTTSTCEPC